MKSLEWALSNIIGIFLKRGNLDTNMHTRRTSYGDEGSDEGDASTSQGNPNCEKTTIS